MKYVSHTTGIGPIDKIRVLIVENDPMVSHIIKNYTESVKEFTVIGVVRTGEAALQFLKLNAVELIILNLYLPQMSGMEVLHTLRLERQDVDVIVITAADNSNTVSKVLRYGVIAYIKTPFQIERYQLVLEAYREFFHKSHRQQHLNQEDIDFRLVAYKKLVLAETPKTISSKTLKTLVRYLASQDQFLSAQEVACGVDISRVTIRRYLEYLVEQGLINRVMNYQSVGRPLHLFKMIDPNLKQTN